jgi:hypothetical protein
MKRGHTAAGIPPPPKLHWTIVLLLGIVTVGIFIDAWLIVQAVWVKKFDRASRSLALCIIGIVLGILGSLFEWVHAPHSIEYPTEIVGLVISVVASFSVRDSLGVYITSITGRPTYLSGVMTLFFASVYLQYHMNRVRSFQRQTATTNGR